MLDVGSDDDRIPALLDRLAAPGTDGRVERIVLFHVHAYDWNCQQHITPRFTAEEFDVALGPLRGELARLRAENDVLRTRSTGPSRLRAGSCPAARRRWWSAAPRSGRRGSRCKR